MGTGGRGCHRRFAVMHGEVAGPLHLRHDQVGEGSSLLHHLIRVERGASLMLLESGTVTNKVLEVEV